MKTAKHETMRSQNASVLFQCLRESGPLTRHELQHKTGLSWGAVSSIINTFLSHGMLTEMPTPAGRAGRTPTSLDIHPQNNLIIGVDLHAQGISCVVADLRARVLVSGREAVMHATQRGFLEQAMSMIDGAIGRVGLDMGHYIGIGVSVQGSVDTLNGISLQSPHLPEWNNVPVSDIFRQRFGLPVVLVHDTNAMMLAEQRNGNARNVRDLVFIRLDMGLGMALAVDGRVYVGADGNAGEFGHMVINPDGPLCTCGNHGCLEAYASGRSILQKVYGGIKQGCSDLQLTGASFDQDLSLVAQAARDGSTFYRGLFENMGMYLGIGIANLINMLNPEMIVIAGDMAKHGDLYMDMVHKVLRRNIWNASRANLVLSSLGTDATIGATLMLASQMFAGKIAHPIAALFASPSEPEEPGDPMPNEA